MDPHAWKPDLRQVITAVTTAAILAGAAFLAARADTQPRSKILLIVIAVALAVLFGNYLHWESRAAKRRAVEAGDSETHAPGEVSRLRDMLAESNRELAAARENRDTAARDYLEIRWQLDYGSPKPELRPLPDDALRLARAEIAKLAPRLGEVERAVEPLRTRLYNAWVSKGDNSVEAYLARFVDDRVSTPMRRSLGLLGEMIREGGDSRAALILYYERYNSFRRWIKNVGEIDLALLSSPDFREWRAADRRLFERLDELLAIPELRSVRDKVSKLRETFDYPDAMPWD